MAVTLLVPAAGQVAILQIRFLEGEGAVRAPGSRSARPLAVEVTDEAGHPVPGAAVSFHLPEDGVGGAFANGLHTDVVLTDPQGRAAMHPIHVGRVPGPFQIRVVAVKEQARAGVLSQQYIAESKSAAASAKTSASAGHRRARWIAIAAIVAGSAAAGAFSAVRQSPAPASAPSAPPAAGAISAPPVSIGVPTSSVGKP